MKPLLFVNWASVSARFTALMWSLAAVLATVILIHALGHGAHAASQRAGAAIASGGSPTPVVAQHPARSASRP